MNHKNVYFLNAKRDFSTISKENGVIEFVLARFLRATHLQLNGFG